MKKVFLVPVMVIATFASQASAEEFCLWSPGGGCYEITADANETAAEKRANCAKNAWVFSGNKGDVEEGADKFCQGGTFVVGKDNNPPGPGSVGDPLGCCNWADGTDWCDLVYTTTDVANCSQGAAQYWSGSICGAKDDVSGRLACPTSTPTYDGKQASCNAYCYWPATSTAAAGCFLLAADAEGDCDFKKSNCQSYGGPDGDGHNALHNTNNCNGLSPILKINPNMGLTVATHGRALHISSDRNATVTLYTLAGQKVLSGSVQAGNKVFSLMGQNPGVYYAVVQSGSYTQTVNVVLK